MKYVLITLSGGIINKVKFYAESWKGIRDLISFVQQMDPDDEDAAIYGPEGLIVNAKAILDENVVDADLNSIYLIVNPSHGLGNLIMTMDEPVGYPDPLEALTVLENVRKYHGMHISLFRAEPISDVLVKRKDLEAYNAGRKVVDFDYGLISEYIDQKDGESC